MANIAWIKHGKGENSLFTSVLIVTVLLQYNVKFEGMGHDSHRGCTVSKGSVYKSV